MHHLYKEVNYVTGKHGTKVFRIKLSFIFFLLFILLFAGNIFPQQDSVMVVPGEEYRAGSVHRFFFGDMWRDVWTTPVKIKVLNLKTFAGGLAPNEEGGGMQTKSLHFKGADGKEYKFRSIDKFPDKALPEDFRGTFVSDIVKDLISSANPYAPLMAVPVLDALHILNARPKLVYLPDDPALGKYREKYGGIPGTIEENPKDGKNGTRGFADSKKIEGTYDFFDKLEGEEKNKPDEKDFLTARLADFIIGDWDRHTDQWKWARYKEGGKDIWKPIPRDRDQAFAMFNGFVPFLATASIEQLTNFSDDYNIDKLSHSGRYVDRRVLVSITRPEWDSVTTYVQSALTDSVLLASINQMPREIKDSVKNMVYEILKKRRDKLNEASAEFYHKIFKYVTIRGTNEDETAVVQRLDNGSIDVSMANRKEGVPFFHRIYNEDETAEVRLIMLGGNDSVAIKGNVDKSVQIIVSGGKGKDFLIDSSRVSGFLKAANETDFYYKDEDETIEGPGTEMYYDTYVEPEDKLAKYEPEEKDYGHSWSTLPWLQINSDVGFLFGAGRALYAWGFQSKPYIYKMELFAGYATTPAAFRFSFDGIFYRFIKGTRLLFSLRTTDLNIINFYGYGNMTTFDKDLEDSGFYRVKEKLYALGTALQFPINKSYWFTVALDGKYSKTIPVENTLIYEQQPYGMDSRFYLKASAGFTYDTRDNIAAPDTGLYIDASASYYPVLERNRFDFWRFSGNANFYIPFRWLINSTLAIKTGGAMLKGTYPYFEAAYLGGSDDLRGFGLNRFAGDAAVFSTFELRNHLGKIKLFVPLEFVLHVFYETGRVFMNDVSHGGWHQSYGSGISLSVLDKFLTGSFYAANSSEDLRFYFTTGYAF